MCDEDNGCFLSLPEAQQFPLQPDASEGVQRCEGLIEQENFGATRERASQGHPLGHSARQTARIFVLKIIQPNQIDVVASFLDSFFPRCGGESKCHVVVHCQPGKKAMLLEDYSSIQTRSFHRLSVQ